MKKCKYCQSEIDSKAKICPNCKKKQGLPKWLVVIICVVGVIIIGSIFSGGGEETAKEGNGSDDKKQPTEKFTYEITNQYLGEYAITYYVEGTVKNNRDIDYEYVNIEFICYDAEGNSLGTAEDYSDNLLANQTWKFKASSFDDVKNIDHCEFHEISSW